MRPWFSALVLLAACGGSAPCDLDAATDGRVSGTVDGAAWSTGGAAWSETGEGIQIVTGSEGGYRVTISALKSVGGASVLSDVEQGAFPIEVDFGDEAAGFALLYPEGAGSVTTKGGGGGTLSIESLEADVLAACFAFDTSDGRAVDAAVRASKL